MTVKHEEDDSTKTPRMTEILPSFGNQLEQFKATPPRSSSRITRSSSRTLSSATRTASLTIKKEDEESDEPTSPSRTGSMSARKSRHASTSPSKKRKVHDVRAFEGMAEVPDRLAENLDILFCGFNPGVRSSEEGFHYAHPSNRFYRILHDSGLTPHKLKPSESPEMPAKYGLGLTDLHRKCTARADQVPSLIFQAGASTLLEKLVHWKPKTVCFVGMDVYRNFRKHFPAHLLATSSSPVKKDSPQALKLSQSAVKLEEATSTIDSPSPHKGKGKKSSSDVQLGLQKLVLSVPTGKDLDAARHLIRLFVIPSTSGLAAGYTDADRVALLIELKDLFAQIKAGGYQESSDSVVLDAEEHIEASIVKIKNEGLDALDAKAMNQLADEIVKKKEEQDEE